MTTHRNTAPDAADNDPWRTDAAPVPADLPRRTPASSRRFTPEAGRARHRGDPENLTDWVGDLTNAEDAGNTAHAGTAMAESETAAQVAPEELPQASDGSELSRAQLIERLDGLAVMADIGGDSLPAEMITTARRLLDQAGARLRLSTDHTVVALAGGTGSGKSALFNALCGLDFSKVGILRPTTMAAHACVWGADGASSLLDWLGVSERLRHSRSSELDRSDDELTGLILLDLPDHDSVQANQVMEAERLLGIADLMVWVLDPQKYADAAIHHRYLAQLAGHESVMVTVLNQVDRLTGSEAEECLLDLQRLLETEAGTQPRIITASSLTGTGVAEVRELLAVTVRERQAALQRLGADLDRIVAQFARYTGPQLSRNTDGALVGVPPPVREHLSGAVLDATGLSGIAAATETALERAGAAYIAWPVAQWVRRVRRGSNRHMRLDELEDATRGSVDARIGTQRATLEAALDDTARETAAGLPDPWPARLRDAAHANAAELPAQLDAALGAVVPEPHTPTWWRLARGTHYVLLVVAGFSLVWLGTLAGVRLAGVSLGTAAVDDFGFALLAGVLLVASLAVGWLAEIGCRNLVDVAATRLRDQIERPGRARVLATVREQVLAPLERELGEYERYRAALAVTRPERP